MTREEIDAAVKTIDALVDKLSAATCPSAEDGKVVWPLEGAVEPDDALATLYDMSDSDIWLTFFDAAGEEETDDLHVAVISVGTYPGAPPSYWRKPLKKMLEDELQLQLGDDAADNKRARLLARLISAFDEPA